MTDKPPLGIIGIVSANQPYDDSKESKSNRLLQLFLSFPGQRIFKREERHLHTAGHFVIDAMNG